MTRERRSPCTWPGAWPARTLVLLLCGAAFAFAEDAAASDETPARSDAPSDAAVHPPELVAFAEAVYPEQARATGREARVLLRLTIDAEGRVTEAEVTDPAGHGFDEAARDAALRLRFSPARRGDRPVASRILYAYEFRLPPAPPTDIPAAEIPAAPIADAPSRPARAADTPPRPAPAPVVPAAPAAPAVEVTVRGASEVERIRRSAEAVHVIETAEAQRQTADLGEVLARSEGVGVRRAGGLGSGARFSLGGLAGDQVRFFLDGVPLDLSGYSLGIANVPVNVVDRVEIYRGVVPVRFGADALGGAVNLVTEQGIRGTRTSASYQVGSFGTYRLTLGARHLHRPSGLFTRVNGFLDHARNDYPIDVEVPDALGRLVPARVRRFHDRYTAAGGGAEVGFVRRPWAERLLLRAFYTEHDRDVQHNGLMTVPYGEVTYGKQSAGAHLQYAQPLSEEARLEAVAGYSHVRTAFRDLSTCRYDWSGRCVWKLPQPGEIDASAIDQRVHDHTAFARLNLAWNLAPAHLLRLGVSPTFTTRAGVNRAVPEGDYDPLTAQRDLLSGVAGVEYEANPLEGQLSNIAFLKGYLQVARTEEQLPSGFLRDLDRESFRMGVGDGLRFRFTEELYAKASYEYATRLPNPEELFGDGVLVVENLHLDPEASHNLNLGATLERAETGVGQLRLSVNGFGRFADNLIVLLSSGSYFRHESVLSARSLGVEAAAGWTSPGDWLALDGHVTWQDLRNTSSEGAFGAFKGDRIPNRPYLFASGTARVQGSQIALPGDTLSLSWITRYVREFFRGWESVGAADAKLVIPSQLLHTVALTYTVERGEQTVSGTVEVQNLTDAMAFDYFGVQLPGRAAYAKVVVDL